MKTYILRDPKTVEPQKSNPNSSPPRPEPGLTALVERHAPRPHGVRPRTPGGGADPQMILALAGVNPQCLTGAAEIPDARTSHRPNSMVPEHPGLRWARQDSVDLIGNSGQRPSPVRDRRGRELNGSATGPGSFSWPATASGHNLGMKKIWSLRPRGTSAKNWSLELSRRASGSRHYI